MQTISWEDEINLIDGIPYNIDFYQDFSTIYLNEELLIKMSIASIIEFINNHKTEIEVSDVHKPIAFSYNSYHESLEFWKIVDKFTKKEKKLAIEWENGKKKRVKDGKKLFAEIDSGEYFLKTGGK